MDALRGAVHDRPDPLHVGVPAPLGATVGVAQAHAEPRRLAADVTDRCHRALRGRGDPSRYPATWGHREAVPSTIRRVPVLDAIDGAALARVVATYRDALRAHLTARGIGSEIYYPVPMHQQECFAYLSTDSSLLPNATMLAKQCLSIPIYPELEAEHTAEVASAIGEFLCRARSGI